MKIKALIDEDFINYKKPSMFIATSKCSFKCDKECGETVCQNSALAATPTIEIHSIKLVNRFYDNPITEAIVFSGLEPCDTPEELFTFIGILMDIGINNFLNLPDIIIYTGYYPSEVQHIYRTIRNIYKGKVIFKFGRFIPNRPHRFDEVLGVELSSDNQFAFEFGKMKPDEEEAELYKFELFYKKGV